MVAGSEIRPKARKGGAALLSTGVMLTVLSLFVGTASASGEYTTASLTSPTSGTASTFVWSYEFHQNDGHALSNIAIRFCSPSLLDHVTSAGPDATVQSNDLGGGHTGFGPGIIFEVQDPTGTLTVTFDQEYGIAADGMEIQSHSGDGQDGDLVSQVAGPAACPATTTTTVIDNPTTTTTVIDNPTTTTTVIDNPTTTTTVIDNPTTTTTVIDNPTTTTTVVNDPTTTTVAGNPTTTTVAGTNTGVSVLGETITAGDALARTGSDTRAQLALAGLALTLGGIAVMFGERKKRALTR